MPSVALALSTGAAMGLVISSLGAGGSLFIVPVLVYVFAEPIGTATGTSLAVVSAAALVGAIGHARRGHVAPRVVVSFGGAGMVGAFAGAALQPLVDERVVFLCLAATLALASARMIFGRTPVAAPDAPPRPAIVILALGTAVGLVTGFLGLGGGFVIVPTLVWGARLPLRTAIGTSLAVVALSAITGAVTHAWRGSMDVGLAASVGAGAVVGALAGAPLSGRLPERPLRVFFGVLCALMAAYFVWDRWRAG